MCVEADTLHWKTAQKTSKNAHIRSAYVTLYQKIYVMQQAYKPTNTENTGQSSVAVLRGVPRCVKCDEEKKPGERCSYFLCCCM